jgi:hypothetical protein
MTSFNLNMNIEIISGNFMDLHLIYEETSLSNEKYIAMPNMVRI